MSKKEPCVTSTQRVENRADRGASFTEYALLVSLIALASLALLRTTGEQTTQTFSQVNSAIEEVSPDP